VVSRIIPGQQDAYRHFMGRVDPLLADSGMSGDYPQSIGIQKPASMQISITGGSAVGAGMAAATLTLLKSSTLGTAAAVRERIMTRRIVSPSLRSTTDYSGADTN
jgi:hypothetical protein